MSDKLSTIKEKVRILNEAAKAYYQENREIMPNIDYDRLYDELGFCKIKKKQPPPTLALSNKPWEIA